jgi:hypothetical protein
VGLYRSRLTLAMVEQIFKRRGWRYELIEDLLFTGFEGVPIFLSVDEDREILLLEVPLAPGRGMPGYRAVRPDRERDVAVYLAAVNYQLALGAFTRDHRDGEIRYESSVPVTGGLLSDDQLQQVIEVGVAAAGTRGPTIVALLLGRMSLQQALEELDEDRGIPPEMVV